jgi:hypothetical protein
MSHFRARNLHLGSDLNQKRLSSARLNSATARIVTDCSSKRNVPPPSSAPTTHSSRTSGCDDASSINGMEGSFGSGSGPLPAATMRRISLPPFRCNACAVRFRPVARATHPCLPYVADMPGCASNRRTGHAATFKPGAAAALSAGLNPNPKNSFQPHVRSPFSRLPAVTASCC